MRVWATGQADPRTVPRRKGPDLGALARVRERASGEGAEEAVLVAPSGSVLEAATASVLWWEDDTLCLPPPRLPVLPGVTVALVQERARREGIPVAHRERTVAGLDGREVWLVNALHGIRPVTGWIGVVASGTGAARPGMAGVAGQPHGAAAEQVNSLPENAPDHYGPAHSKVPEFNSSASADNPPAPCAWRLRSGCTR